MDIVGSILKKMTGPPVILDEKARLLRKKQMELEKKQREEIEKRLNEFRQKVKERVTTFDANEEQGPKLVFDPMDKPRRAIIHDIAETMDLVPMSFGEDEIDRHVVIFRQHTVPSEPELNAMRRNEPYVPQDDTQVEEEEEVIEKSVKRKKGQPEYLQKYQKHLGGLAVAKAAAKTTVTERTYGFVSSEQKKDKRTIEETLADIRARKKQKLDNSNLPQE